MGLRFSRVSSDEERDGHRGGKAGRVIGHQPPNLKGPRQCLTCQFLKITTQKGTQQYGSICLVIFVARFVKKINFPVSRETPLPGEYGTYKSEMCSGSEAGSYLRLIDSCITQRKAQGPSRTCNESKEEAKI